MFIGTYFNRAFYVHIVKKHTKGVILQKKREENVEVIFGKFIYTYFSSYKAYTHSLSCVDIQRNNFWLLHEITYYCSLKKKHFFCFYKI